MDGINKKIKILYTIPNFNTAGSGKVLYDLAKGLDSERFEVSIACNDNNGAFFKEVKGLGLPIYLIYATVSLRPYSNLIYRVRPFKDFIKAHQFDIVHSWHWSSDWTEALAARLSGVKWVYTKKAMSWGNWHWKIRSFLADFIITINDEMRDYFPYKKNQKLIPLGIDTAFFSPELFPHIKDLRDIFKIITVANLVPVKGVEVLIKAIASLNDRSIKLMVLGDDKSDYGNSLKSLVKEFNLEEQVMFLGKKPDVRPYIADADLYVIPTLNEGRKEGMPMALLEAMSMGIPVLGADISGIKFVLKDFKNLLFEAGNETVLAKEIQNIKILSIQERLELGNKLRSYVINNFNYDVFIAEHEKLYESILI